MPRIPIRRSRPAEPVFLPAADIPALGGEPAPEPFLEGLDGTRARLSTLTEPVNAPTARRAGSGAGSTSLTVLDEARERLAARL